MHMCFVYAKRRKVIFKSAADLVFSFARSRPTQDVGAQGIRNFVCHQSRLVDDDHLAALVRAVARSSFSLCGLLGRNAD